MGLLSAIGLGIAYGLLTMLLRIQFSAIYIGVAYVIAEVVRKYGRGVTQKFSVLGAVLVFISILIGDTIASFGLQGWLNILVHPSSWLGAVRILAQLHLTMNFSNMLGVLFRVYGIWYAYYNSRFI